jgi:hypothetical protein
MSFTVYNDQNYNSSNINVVSSGYPTSNNSVGNGAKVLRARSPDDIKRSTSKSSSSMIGKRRASLGVSVLKVTHLASLNFSSVLFDLVTVLCGMMLTASELQHNEGANSSNGKEETSSSIMGTK